MASRDPRARYYHRINILATSVPADFGAGRKQRPFSIPAPSPPRQQQPDRSRSPADVPASPSAEPTAAPYPFPQGLSDDIAFSLPPWPSPLLGAADERDLSSPKTTPGRARSVSVSTGSRSAPIFIPSRFDGLSDAAQRNHASDSDSDSDIDALHPPLDLDAHVVGDMDMFEADVAVAVAPRPPPKQTAPHFVPPHLQAAAADDLSGVRWELKKDEKRRAQRRDKG